MSWQASLACSYLRRDFGQFQLHRQGNVGEMHNAFEEDDDILPGSFFERQPVLAFGIAFFATRHKIAFGGFTTPNDRHEMIHGQNCRREFAAAMVAEAKGSLALPPLAGTQLSSLSALAADFFFTDGD
jgi:hypothetical protein